LALGFLLLRDHIRTIRIRKLAISPVVKQEGNKS
jgi:hypothetical protein